MFPRSKYRRLLEDEGFSAWIENVSRGSKVNAEVSLRRIGHICNLFQITQRDLANMSKGEAGDFLFRMVSRLEKEGKRSSSIAGYMKTLKGWWLVEINPRTGRPYFPLAVEYVPEIARTGRHYNAAFVVATQLVSDLMGRGGVYG